MISHKLVTTQPPNSTAPAVVEVADGLANARKSRVGDLMSTLILALLCVVGIIVVLEAQAAGGL